MKKILILGNSFYPEISPRSFRTTELVKQFSNLGHSVTVTVPEKEFLHAEFEKKYGVEIKELGKKRIKEINTSGSNKFVVLVKKTIRKVLDYFFYLPSLEWAFKVRSFLKKEKKHYDLLISIAYPHSIHWGVASIINKIDITNTWVADCGDPFMGNRIKKPFYFKYVEKYWCARVDYISVPFKGAVSGYYSEFKDKIKVIPQGFDFDKVKLSEYNKNIVPTFAYAGGLMFKMRDPSNFLEYLLELGIDFKFIFYTQSDEIIEPFVKKSNGKIIKKDFVPRNQLLMELSKMDFIVNFENAVSIQLPSKLIDYYLTKRPILSIASDVLDKKTVEEFLRNDYSNQFSIENPDQYKIQNVCNQFLKLTNGD